MTTHEADPIVRIEALIVERRQALDQLEAACANFRRAFSQASTPAAMEVGPAAPARRKPLTAGSLPERIVSTLKAAAEPLRFDALVEHVKAPASAVRTALDTLIAEQRATRTGKSRGTRYSA